MEIQELYVVSTGTALGTLTPVEEAVAAGRYDPGLAVDDGFVSVSVCEGTPAVELAARAGSQALERAGLGTAAALLLHAHLGYQGLDDFASAAYLHHRLLTGEGLPVEVSQASNGGMAAFELAAYALSARPDPAFALLTTSDVFAPPEHARYGTAGALLGDAGTSLVLSNRGGALRVRSIVSVCDSTHEPMQRAGSPWGGHPGHAGWPVDVAARVQSYVVERGPEAMVDLVDRIRVSERRTVDQALEEAGLTASDVDHWVFPTMGLTLTDWRARGLSPEDTAWRWGRRVGHLGAGDQFAALDHLWPQIAPGEHVVLHGAGTGFTFTTSVLTAVADGDSSPC